MSHKLSLITFSNFQNGEIGYLSFMGCITAASPFSTSIGIRVKLGGIHELNGKFAVYILDTVGIGQSTKMII